MLLKDFLKKYWWRYSIGVLFLIAVDLIQIIIPKKVGEIVDILKTPSPDLQLILTIVTGVVFLAIGLSLGRFLWRVTIIGVARLFEFKTINKMFFHIMDLDQDFYDRWRTGDLMTRFTSDTQTVMRMLGFGVIMLVDTLVVTLMTVLAMGEFVSWKLTLLSTIPIPFIAIVSVSFGRIIHKRFTKLQECTSELSNITEESVSGIQVVKVFSNQQTMKDIFNSRSKKFYDAQVSLTRIWGLMFPLINFLGAFSSLLVFFFGGKMVVNGEITLGNFVMTNSYVGMLIWPMMAFGWLMNILQGGQFVLGFQLLLQLGDHGLQMFGGGNPFAVVLGPLHIPRDGLLEFSGVEGLFEVVGCTQADGVLGGFEGAEAGEHDDGHLVIQAADFPKALNAGFAGHLDVHDDGIRRVFAHDGEAFVNRIDAHDVIGVLKEKAQAFPRAEFVVDHQQPVFDHKQTRTCIRRRGSGAASHNRICRRGC